MCAVYFLAIFRRNFNGIIVFYVCIINTNSIHASYPLPSGLWPERGQWSVSKLAQDTHPQRMPRAMAVIVVGVCECACLCVCVYVNVSCVSPRVQDTFAQILIWRQCVRATGNGLGPQRGLSHAAPLRFITTTNGNLGSYTDTILL